MSSVRVYSRKARRQEQPATGGSTPSALPEAPSAASMVHDMLNAVAKPECRRPQAPIGDSENSLRSSHDLVETGEAKSMHDDFEDMLVRLYWQRSRAPDLPQLSLETTSPDELAQLRQWNRIFAMIQASTEEWLSEELCSQLLHHCAQPAVGSAGVREAVLLVQSACVLCMSTNE